jgi:hypothetical protein
MPSTITQKATLEIRAIYMFSNADPVLLYMLTCEQTIAILKGNKFCDDTSPQTFRRNMAVILVHRRFGEAAVISRDVSEKHSVLGSNIKHGKKPAKRWRHAELSGRIFVRNVSKLYRTAW